MARSRDFEKIELKPCPFCGSENVVLEPYKARKGYEATIQCNGGCLLHMHTITYDTEEEAVETVIKEWNKRTEKADTLRKFAERLKKYYNNLTGASFAYLISYHIDLIAQEMLKEEENND